MSTECERSISPTMIRLRNLAAVESIERIRKDWNRTSGVVRRMLAYLEQHLFDPGLQVRTLKAALGIRDNTQALRFHSKVGRPPKAYLTERRLEVARRLLRDTDLKLWRISELVGFSSLPVFSKRFAGVVGMRPTVYRQQVRRELERPRFSSRELEKALEGKLREDDALRLIESLGARYPEELASAFKATDGVAV